jgi:hypothetical protein
MSLPDRKRIMRVSAMARLVTPVGQNRKRLRQ